MAKSKAQSKTSLDQRFGNSGLIAGLMVICTLAVAASFVVTRLLLSDIRFNNRVLSEKRRVNDILERNISQLEPLKTNFEDLEKQGPLPSTILNALPMEQAYHELAGELEILAGLTETKLLSVVLDPTDTILTSGTTDQTAATVPVGPQTLAFTIQVNGEYRGLHKFIEALELLARPIHITSATINGSDPSVELQLKASTFFQARTEISDQTRTLE